MGQGKKLWEHVLQAASPCVRPGHLAFLSETLLSHSGTCLRRGVGEPPLPFCPLHSAAGATALHVSAPLCFMLCNYVQEGLGFILMDFS